MGSCNFIFFLFYFICLWVKPCNSCNLSPKKTSCLTWRCKHQRIFPFPQQWCTPGWKIRTSDISDLTSKTFCLAEGKYLSVLKPAFFSGAGVNDDGYIQTCYYTGSLCLIPHPGTSRTHMGVVPAGCSVRPASDKTVTPGNWVCNEKGDTEQGVVNLNEDVCLHFDKPECCLPVVLL